MTKLKAVLVTKAKTIDLKFASARLICTPMTTLMQKKILLSKNPNKEKRTKIWTKTPPKLIKKLDRF